MIVPVHRCAATVHISPPQRFISQHMAAFIHIMKSAPGSSQSSCPGVSPHSSVATVKGVAWQWHIIVFAQLSLPKSVAQWLVQSATIAEVLGFNSPAGSNF